jgi:hypothetical protein
MKQKEDGERASPAVCCYHGGGINARRTATAVLGARIAPLGRRVTMMVDRCDGDHGLAHSDPQKLNSSISRLHQKQDAAIASG